LNAGIAERKEVAVAKQWAVDNNDAAFSTFFYSQPI
jgi:hypothetical protein